MSVRRGVAEGRDPKLCLRDLISVREQSSGRPGVRSRVPNSRFDQRAGTQLADRAATVDLRAAQLDCVPVNVCERDQRISVILVTCRQRKGHLLRQVAVCVMRRAVMRPMVMAVRWMPVPRMAVCWMAVSRVGRGGVADAGERREGSGERMDWRHKGGNQLLKGFRTISLGSL
jgi:hypothetical protein